jgi:hypothetical protein
MKFLVKKALQRYGVEVKELETAHQGALLHQAIWDILEYTEGVLEIDFSGIDTLKSMPIENSIGCLWMLKDRMSFVNMPNFEDLTFIVGMMKNAEARAKFDRELKERNKKKDSEGVTKS